MAICMRFHSKRIISAASLVIERPEYNDTGIFWVA